MRRVMLLALLALTLPAAALANSITFSNSKSGRLATGVYLSGEFQSGTISGSITNGGSVDISVVGDSKTPPFFSCDIGPLTDTHCPPPVVCFTFKTGTVTIDNAANATVFTRSITNGGLNVGVGENNASVFGNLVLSSMAPNGGSTGFNFVFMGNKLTKGTGQAVPAIAPEPSSF